MLIVVSIIAILVAVAIPSVSSNLNKTKISKDDANFRTAKTVAMINYMNNDDTNTNKFQPKTRYVFDATKGEFILATGSWTQMGAGTYEAVIDADDTNSKTGARKRGDVICAYLRDSDGSLGIKWVTKYDATKQWQAFDQR